MLNIILARLMTLIPTALIGTAIIFIIVHLTPGGPAETIAGPDATAEYVAELEAELGLDRPLVIQYADWLRGIATGDMGRSFITSQMVADTIWRRAGVTFTIAAEAFVFSVIVGIGLGLFAAVRKGGISDGTIRGFSGLGLAVPEFWIGMLAINLFALQLFWLPGTGYVAPGDDLIGHIRSVILPVATLSLGPIAVLVRFSRSAMVEALEGDYIRTAWAMGLPARQIYLRFALKNALVSIITIGGIIASVLLGGTVLVERVFAIPGLGDLLTTAVLSKDFPLVQGATLLLMIAVIVVNLIVDIACALVDPRTREGVQ